MSPNRGSFFFLCIIGTSLILLQSICMRIIKKIIPILINRYFLISIGFVVWMLFFDQRDFFLQRERKAELDKVEAAKKYYQDEISHTKSQLDNLQNNPASIEKFARERYLLKRDGEALYLFEDSSKGTPNK